MVSPGYTRALVVLIRVVSMHSVIRVGSCRVGEYGWTYGGVIRVGEHRQ